MFTVTEGIISVFASKEVSINGVLGHCHSLNKMKPFVSDSKVIGKGNTHTWSLGSIDPEKTLTFVYETKNADAKARSFFLQLKTVYRDEDGSVVTRITSI